MHGIRRETLKIHFIALSACVDLDERKTTGKRAKLINTKQCLKQ